MGKSVDILDAINSKPQNDGLVSQATMDKVESGLRSIGIPVGGTPGTTSGLDKAMQDHADKVHPLNGSGQ